MGSPKTIVTVKISSNGSSIEEDFDLDRVLSDSDKKEIMKVFKGAMYALAKLPVDNAITLDN